MKALSRKFQGGTRKNLFNLPIQHKISHMLRNLTMLLTTAFWLGMMGQLVHREYFQVTSPVSLTEWMPITTTAIREDYKSIRLGPKQIGFEYNALRNFTDRTEGVYENVHNSFMAFNILGQENEILIRGTAWMDSTFHLKSFKCLLQIQNDKTHMEGTFETGFAEILVQENDLPPVRRKISVPEPVFYSEIMDNLWTPAYLRVGKEGTLKVFNPLLLETLDLSFRVEHKEPVEINGKQEEAYVIRVTSGPVETRYWVSEDSITLKKEMPTGLSVIRTPGWEIFKTLREHMHAPVELLSLYSIPSDRILENPEVLQKLEVQVHLPNQNRNFLLQKQNPALFESTRFEDLKPLEPSLAEMQQPSSLIQSDAAEMIITAKNIVGQETSVLQSAVKIMDWVHTHMSPRPSAAVPSALQVLKSRKGDCNEYTTLFTALARAAGIPTQTVAGLVYRDGRFYYHAWAAVFAKEWFYIDPTLRQFPVDVTHIPLVLGGIHEQVAFASQTHQIKVEIKDAQ